MSMPESPPCVRPNVGNSSASGGVLLPLPVVQTPSPTADSTTITADSTTLFASDGLPLGVPYSPTAPIPEDEALDLVFQA